MLTRRHLLTTVSILPLAACGNYSGLNQAGTAAMVTAQLVADAQGLASALKTDFPSIAKALTSDAANKVQTYLSTLSTLTSSISTQLSQSAAKPIIQQVVGVVQQIVGVAGPLLPPPWGLAVTAAVALLPALASAVQIVLPPGAGGAGVMTTDEARKVLGIPVVAG